MLLPEAMEAMEAVQARALVSCGVRLSPPAAAAHRSATCQLLLAGSQPRAARARSIQNSGFVKMGKVRSADREKETEKRAQEKGALEGFTA